MDRPSGQGLPQQIGFFTSVDIARKQTYHTRSLLGTKRPYARLEPICPSAADDQVLADVTVTSNRSEFKRPCIGFPAKRRFKASRILNATATESHIAQVSEYTEENFTLHSRSFAEPFAIPFKPTLWPARTSLYATLPHSASTPFIPGSHPVFLGGDF